MRLSLLLLLVAALPIFGGCSQDDGMLHGAANPVPLYQPSRLQDLRPIEVGWVQTNKRDRVEWVWKTTDPSGSVIEFYKKALPAAKMQKNQDGTATFTWTTFPGAEPDESVVVAVDDDGTFRVIERLAPHKHKERVLLIKDFPKDNDVPARSK